MSRKLIAPLLIVVAIALGYGAWSPLPRTGGGAKPMLTVFCAAGLKKPVEAIAEMYRQELGVEVALQYGGTGTLLSQIQVAQRGDLFIAADDGSLADARKLKLIAESVPMVVQ
ncbi:MAG: substrate-binding domain-containing protein, partial [Roseimicrobium sp.]